MPIASVRSAFAASLMFACAAAASPAAARDITIGSYSLPDQGVVALPVREDRLEGGAFGALDDTLDGALTKAAQAAKFTGKDGKTLSLYGLGGYERIVLVGLGDETPDARALEDFGGTAAQTTMSESGKAVSVLWSGLETDAETPGAHIAYGAALGQYTFTEYLSKDEEDDTGEGSLTVLSASADADREAFEGDWKPVAEAVTFARDLIREPANVVYPESFVSRTRAAFRGERNVSIDVLDVDDMRELGMGAIIGVGQGSARPPRLLVVRYTGGERGDAPVAFVGKGVTFDTGGISIKPSSGMWRMKYDMSGAAAVTGAVLALAKRDAAVNAVSIAALAENMPSATAQRPGDVVRTMSGKTIEILNTDAEGRLLLADAVWYAQDRFNPRILVDLATLTGSVRVALGDEYAGLFSRHDELAAQVTAAAERADEEVWRLPLHPSYAEDIKSDIADIKNISGERLAGAGIGAQVVGTFVKEDTVWAHLDIASRAWPFSDRPTIPKGGAGYGVRLLNQLVMDYYEER